MDNGKWLIDFEISETWDATESYDSKEEAIYAGKCILDDDRKLPDDDQEYFGKEEFEVGQYQKFEPVVYADSVIENLIDQANDQCCEPADDYLSSVPREKSDLLEKYLTEAFLKWADETGNDVNFGSMEHTETIQYPIEEE